MAMKTFYYKMVELTTNLILGWGKIMTTKVPTSTPSRVILSKSEYDYLVTVNANKPQPSDDMHEVRILDNHDGTYTYIENAEHIVSEEDVIENE